jgi:hypothetical protein
VKFLHIMCSRGLEAQKHDTLKDLLILWDVKIHYNDDYGARCVQLIDDTNDMTSDQ